MISRRTILLYNFGLAATLCFAGLLSLYALGFLAPESSIATQAAMRTKVVKEIQEEPDLERLRSAAIFYLRLSEDLKKAKDQETVDVFTNIRYGFFVLAWMFFVGGLLQFGVRKDPPTKSDSE